jgi:Ca2+-binding EF-hand superfamily protein
MHWQKFFDKYDADGDGQIDFREYCRMFMLKLKDDHDHQQRVK